MNRPIAQFGHGRMPLFWLRQIGAEWNCRQCSARMPKNSVALECFKKVSWDSGVPTGMQMWLCLTCAEKMLDEVKTEVELCRVRGVAGYAMIRDM